MQPSLINSENHIFNVNSITTTTILFSESFRFLMISEIVGNGKNMFGEGHSIRLPGMLKFSTHQRCPHGLQGSWLLLLQIYLEQWDGLLD